MGWLIDTSVWIAVERGTLGAADVHAITRQDPVYLSPVNIAEMQFGLELLRAGVLKQHAAASLRHESVGRDMDEAIPRKRRAHGGLRRGRAL